MFLLLWQRPPADHSVSLETSNHNKNRKIRQNHLFCPVLHTYSINRSLCSFSAVPVFPGEAVCHSSSASRPHVNKRQAIFIWIFFPLIFRGQPCLLHLPSQLQLSHTLPSPKVQLRTTSCFNASKSRSQQP